MREAMEDQGFSEAQIEKKIASKRKKLLRDIDRVAKDARPARETHAMAKRKEENNRRMRSALQLSSSYKTGNAFDQELQEEKRVERVAEYERREKDRKKRRREQRERDRKDERKRRKKEEKREENAKMSEKNGTENARSEERRRT